MSGSSTPNAGPSSQPLPPLDLYRALPKSIQKSLIPPNLPSGSQPPSILSLLDIDSSTYNSRLSGKNLILEKTASDQHDRSALVTGKKLHKGRPEILADVRKVHEEKEREREEMGLVGERKRRKIAGSGGVVKKGARVSYESILPLNYLHSIYLSQLLNLPPLQLPQLKPLNNATANPTPTTSSNPSSTPSTPQSTPNTTNPPPNFEHIQSHLLKADFTGLSVSIKSSRNPSLTGIKGIIIEETASTFRLVSPDDITRIIPKNGTLFTLTFPSTSPPNHATKPSEEDVSQEELRSWMEFSPRIEIDLLGSSFGFRTGDRAGRKFRPAQGGGGGSGWGEEWVKGGWADTLEKMDSSKVGGMDQGRKKKKGGNGNNGGSGKKRKRGSSRRKDPPAWGRPEGVS